MKAIVNAKLVMEDGIIWDGVIIWEGERIVRLGWASDIQVPEDAEFTLTPSGSEFFRAVFTATGEDTHGTLTCSLQRTESWTQLNEVDNHLWTFTTCREEPILTPAKAM